MKLNVLLWVVVLLGSFLPRCADGRPTDGSAGRLHGPLLLLGEEFSLWLGAAPRFLSSSAGNRVLLQAEQKVRRSDEPPISLDLTFHLLREVLEMARAEQMAQQADSNRKMMDTFGK
ncbi:corticoliberin-1-like [Stegastes partitus]|uniref:Corticoliberin-1-like n=1 Tax=Stegastes partitus TaxID=144197 RepID=A0A9Y4NRB7_9TELE|nr:PREDICTED: corticoliberin-1-like [Stegastes partitus]